MQQSEATVASRELVASGRGEPPLVGSPPRPSEPGAGFTRTFLFKAAQVTTHDLDRDLKEVRITQRRCQLLTQEQGERRSRVGGPRVKKCSSEKSAVGLGGDRTFCSPCHACECCGLLWSAPCDTALCLKVSIKRNAKVFA